MKQDQIVKLARDIAAMIAGLGIVGAQAYTGKWDIWALLMAAGFLGIPTGLNLAAFLASGQATHGSSSQSQQRSHSQRSSSSPSSHTPNGRADNE